MKYTSKIKEPCSCGANRWRTKFSKHPLKEYSVYVCRKCNKEREISKEQYENER